MWCGFHDLVLPALWKLKTLSNVSCDGWQWGSTRLVRGEYILKKSTDGMETLQKKRFIMMEYGSQATVPFHSIRHPMWRVTRLTKFWFRQPPKLAVTHRDFRQIFDSLAPQATNFIYIWHVIIKWIRHRTKFSVTTVTFRRFGGPRDAWLTNWLKWYSNLKILRMHTAVIGNQQWVPVSGLAIQEFVCKHVALNHLL